MKYIKLIAWMLLLAMLGTALLACRKPAQNGEETTVDNGETEPIPEEGDGWVDLWDTDPTFTPLTDDASYDTNGTLEDGTWFDSFQTQRSLYWKNGPNGEVTFDGDTMKLNGNVGGNHINAHRAVSPTSCYEMELRFKVDCFGSKNWVSVQSGDQRVTIFFSETWLKFNEDQGNGNAKSNVVYVDVGYDWHTYRVLVQEGIAHLYMDGVYLVSFEPETYEGWVNRIYFSGGPVNATTPTVMWVDYVSFRNLERTDIAITSPKAGTVCGNGKATVTVQGALSEELAAANAEVSFYLNEVYAGKAPSNDPKVTFADLSAGVYRVRMECGEESAERVFFVEEEGKTPVSPTHSTQALLQSGYQLRFTVNGDGTVTAGDGFFPLSLSFAKGMLVCPTDAGDKTVAAGNGDYIAVVDGGVIDLYKNGRLLLSERLPYANAATVASVSGNITGLTVEAHNGTLYQKDLSGGKTLNEDMGNISYTYAIEFEYTKGSALDLILTDGAYVTDLSIAADGTVSALAAPQMTASMKAITEAASGTHLYRVQVMAGVAQLFVDNIWQAGWRCPESVAARNLFVSGGGIGRLQIRETGNRYHFAASTTDGDFAEWFSTTGDLSKGGVQALKTYSHDTTVSATVSLDGKTSGGFYLVARYFGGKGVIAGYNVSAGAFQMGLSTDSLKTVRTQAFPAGDVKLSLVAEGDRAVLYCNGTQVGSISIGSINGWGNAGYLNTASGAVKAFAYEGDGAVLKDTSTTLLAGDHTVGIFELKGYIYAIGERTYRSPDGGKSFNAYTNFTYKSYNTIVLNSGKLLVVRRIITNEGIRYASYISSDNGKTFEGPYYVMTDYNDYRFSMNGKVMQTSSGRIIFVSGETENEYMGGIWIYYSDNEGRLWKKSKSEFNLSTTGLNLQEGAAVELENGVIRMYARCDGGFLVYSDSHDNGETFPMEMQDSCFPSTTCAFGVRKDPHTGAIYAAWEYNNINDSGQIQYPRTRIGLAVSYDNAKTWYYVADLDELNQPNSNTMAHWNLGVWPTKDAVFVSAGKQIDGTWYNYTVRIDKADIRPLARFTDLHCLYEDPTKGNEGNRLVAGGVLAISPTTGRVYASGDLYTLSEVKGKRTMLSAEIIASFLNGTLSVENGKATVKVGNAEYVFTAGSTTALIAGEEKQMTFEAVAENGTVLVSVEDLHHVLGLIAKQGPSGAILLTTETDPARVEHLLAQVAIW